MNMWLVWVMGKKWIYMHNLYDVNMYMKLGTCRISTHNLKIDGQKLTWKHDLKNEKVVRATWTIDS